MTGRYSKYPEYHESGQGWCGQIPVDWDFRRSKFLFQIRKRIAGELGHSVLSITQKGIKVKDTESGEGQLSMDYSKYQLVEVGDFAMNHMDLLTGYIDISKYAGVTSPDYRVFCSRDTSIDDRYFLYLYQLAYIEKIFFPLGQGSAHLGRWRLPAEEFKDFRWPVPTRNEQKRIADFLDYETTKIDTLTDKQQQLIILLKEKRQAVISHAVTKGLNPNAPMKDSGVEWLGEVPEHWTTQKLAFHFIAKKGSNAAQLTKEYCESISGNFPVYSGQTSNNGVMAIIDQYEFDTGSEGCLFSTTVGAKAMTIMHIAGKFSLSQNCMIIRPSNLSVNVRFYFYHFQPLFEFERGLIPEHMQASFRMEDLYQYRIAVPPTTEQKEIAEFLNKQCNQIETLISKALRTVELLSERRASLISAAVTGKIDVRNWKPEQSVSQLEFTA